MKSVCQEAQELTTGERNAAYGHPLDNFQITVNLINARFGTKFMPEDFAEIMILCKIARQANCRKRDNLVDIAGYANTQQMVIDERQRREDPQPVTEGSGLPESVRVCHGCGSLVRNTDITIIRHKPFCAYCKPLEQVLEETGTVH